jgi:hypothetical protein
MSQFIVYASVMKYRVFEAEDEQDAINQAVEASCDMDDWFFDSVVVEEGSVEPYTE